MTHLLILISYRECWYLFFYKVGQTLRGLTLDKSYMRTKKDRREYLSGRCALAWDGAWRRRVSWPSRVAVSTWTLRRARERPGRSPDAPVAWSSRRLSYVNRHIEMPTLPPIFDTTLGLGATKPHATCPHPFLHPRERSETLAVVVTFLPFFAGEAPRHAYMACVIVHRCHDVSPTKKIQNKRIYKREGRKNEERARDGISNGGRNFGRETKFPPVRDVIGAEMETRPTNMSRPWRPSGKIGRASIARTPSGPFYSAYKNCLKSNFIKFDHIYMKKYRHLAH